MTKLTFVQKAIQGSEWTAQEDLILPAVIQTRSKVDGSQLKWAKHRANMRVERKDGKIQLSKGDVVRITSKKSKKITIETNQETQRPIGTILEGAEISVVQVEVDSQTYNIDRKDLNSKKFECTHLPDNWVFAIRLGTGEYYKKTCMEWEAEQIGETIERTSDAKKAKHWTNIGHVKNHLRMITGQISVDDVRGDNHPSSGDPDEGAPEFMVSSGSITPDILKSMQVIQYNKINGEEKPVDFDPVNYVLQAKLKKQ